MQEVSRWFLDFVCRGQHNLPKKDSWPLVENLHTQTTAASPSIGRECHLKQRRALVINIHRDTDLQHAFLPQILIGASNSRRLGWLMKISLAVKHSCRISCSVNCTCLPGLPFLTSKSGSIISSKIASSCKIHVSVTLGCNGALSLLTLHIAAASALRCVRLTIVYTQEPLRLQKPCGVNKAIVASQACSYFASFQRRTCTEGRNASESQIDSGRGLRNGKTALYCIPIDFLQVCYSCVM